MEKIVQQEKTQAADSCRSCTYCCCIRNTISAIHNTRWTHNAIFRYDFFKHEFYLNQKIIIQIRISIRNDVEPSLKYFLPLKKNVCTNMIRRRILLRNESSVDDLTSPARKKIPLLQSASIDKWGMRFHCFFCFHCLSCVWANYEIERNIFKKCQTENGRHKWE